MNIIKWYLKLKQKMLILSFTFIIRKVMQQITHENAANSHASSLLFTFQLTNEQIKYPWPLNERNIISMPFQHMMKKNHNIGMISSLRIFLVFVTRGWALQFLYEKGFRKSHFPSPSNILLKFNRLIPDPATSSAIPIFKTFFLQQGSAIMYDYLPF